MSARNKNIVALFIHNTALAALADISMLACKERDRLHLAALRAAQQAHNANERNERNAKRDAAGRQILPVPHQKSAADPANGEDIKADPRHAELFASDHKEHLISKYSTGVLPADTV